MAILSVPDSGGRRFEGVCVIELKIVDGYRDSTPAVERTGETVFCGRGVNFVNLTAGSPIGPPGGQPRNPVLACFDNLSTGIGLSQEAARPGRAFGDSSAPAPRPEDKRATTGMTCRRLPRPLESSKGSTVPSQPGLRATVRVGEHSGRARSLTRRWRAHGRQRPPATTAKPGDPDGTVKWATLREWLQPLLGTKLRPGACVGGSAAVRPNPSRPNPSGKAAQANVRDTLRTADRNAGR